MKNEGERTKPAACVRISLCMCMCVRACACVCVCVCARRGKGRHGQKYKYRHELWRGQGRTLIICFRMERKRRVRASAFFFNRLWPFFADLRRVFIIVCDLHQQQQEQQQEQQQHINDSKTQNCTGASTNDRIHTHRRTCAKETHCSGRLGLTWLYSQRRKHTKKKEKRREEKVWQWRCWCCFWSKCGQFAGGINNYRQNYQSRHHNHACVCAVHQG